MSQMSFLDNTTVEVENRHTRHMLSVLLRKAQDHDWAVADLHKKLDALLALLSGDQAALKAMVVQGAVVPNEDEAAPIVSEELPPLATCPVCAKSADSQEKVEEHFGYRTMEDGKVRVQSWCRGCRALGVQTQPGKRERKEPTFWSKMDAQANAYAKALQLAKKEVASIEVKLKDESLAPSERTALTQRLDAKKAEARQHKRLYTQRVKDLGYQHPHQKPANT